MEEADEAEDVSPSFSLSSAEDDDVSESLDGSSYCEPSREVSDHRQYTTAMRRRTAATEQPTHQVRELVDEASFEEEEPLEEVDEDDAADEEVVEVARTLVVIFDAVPVAAVSAAADAVASDSVVDEVVLADVVVVVVLLVDAEVEKFVPNRKSAGMTLAGMEKA